MKLLILALFFACLTAISGERARYDNYRVYSVRIENEQQLKVLKDLDNNRDGWSFMTSPMSISQSVDILIPPHKFASISDLFETHNLENAIKINNLQE